MSLRFYFGPSGVGKSRRLFGEIISRSMEHPRQNFLVIVPDQFTMQTQKDLVSLHERGGIMNIDVLSFGRLTHRILKEVGGQDIPVLDDTGKSLVLQKVAANLRDQLPALGSHLQKQGYIHEVKSAISEFMQYGIGTEDMPKLIQFCRHRGALVHKLKDLETLYNGFKQFIDGKYITTEETLDVLCRLLPKSRLVAGSVVAFDGFTGFTPIQNRVIGSIMKLARETIVTLTMGAREDPYQLDGEQKLFYLGKKTVAALTKIAGEVNVERGKDTFLLPVDTKRHRFTGNHALMALESNLFRYQYHPFSQPQNNIRIFEASTPKEEVRQAGLMILGKIRDENKAFRDIGVIAGDLESYAPYIEVEFAQMGIPFFIDRTREIVMNPMIEFIKSALSLYLRDFSYESVFHYLRSGLSDITREETDELEQYAIQVGIRGYHRWNRCFTRKTREMGDSEEPLLKLNEIRERLMAQVAELRFTGKNKVEDYVNHLYDFLVVQQVQKKLLKFETMFTEKGQLSRAREYAQIYRLVVELLEQIHQLLGEESISLQEFSDILEAGFGEIQVGTIPQNVDRVVVGDMERTRLKQVKVLLFLGVNDGNIPKSASKGGIISDIDREFLKESELELAPSPRQRMYIQRLYLYLNMTKPSEALYISYAKVNSTGKSIRPAYLVDTVKKLFPLITIEYPQNRPFLEQVVTPEEGLDYLARGLREYVEGAMEFQQYDKQFFALYQAYEELTGYRSKRDSLTEAAFRRYEDNGLSKAVARALYGLNLENSVSRLETYASCAYRHFLEYGLSLREREEFGFEAVDMGNVFHEVLNRFAKRLEGSGHSWFDFPREFGEKAVKESLESYAALYGNTVLYSSARDEYAITRMGRILTRTVLTLQNQIQKGAFYPESYEVSFHYAENLDSVNITLTEEEKMRLRGRIDRVDVAEDGEKVYVKVIDYKSGRKGFDLAALYYGLQLQLVVYMNAALEIEGRKHPGKEIVPAAMLYYHIDDPTIETPVELDEDELNNLIMGKLKMNGVVNGEEDIISRLDSTFTSKSDVIPVERKKDGSFSARSSLMTERELKVISDYVNQKVRSIGQEILNGCITLNPYEYGKGTSQGADKACTWCTYKKVCGFDSAIPGYQWRELVGLDRETALEYMEDTRIREHESQEQSEGFL